MKSISWRLIAILVCVSVLFSSACLTASPQTATAAALQTIPYTNRADMKADLCYQIVTDRFFDGDTSNNNPSQSPNLYDAGKTNWKLYWGGDFAGIQAKMSYLSSMGVTSIWISPPVDNINVAATYNGTPNAGYHGYWARDFKVPEEHFGSASGASASWTVFQNMVTAAHNANIKVIIDWAPNHTSPADVNNPSFAEDGALYNNGTYMARYSNDPNGYFHHNGGITNWDDRYETQYKNLADLADFEQTNPTINQYLKDSISAWLPNTDGIRLDAVKHMTFGWQRSYADYILSNKDMFLFGEWYLGGFSDPLYADNVRFAGESGISELDFYMNKAMRDTFGYGVSMTALDAAVTKTGADYKYKENLVTFLDNHDMPRFLSINNNNTQLHLALAFLMTLRGTPCLFYGTEQYIHNDTNGGGDPYNRPMMNSWNTSTTAYSLISTLSNLRQNQPALQFGSHQQRWLNDDVYIYERKFNGDVTLVAINKSASATYNITGLYTYLPAGTYTDQLNGLLGGFNVTVNNNGGNNSVNAFSLGPGKAMVWSYKRSSEPSTPEVGSAAPVLTRSGNTVTVDGRGFGSTQGTSKVYFVAGGTNYQATVQSWSANRIVVTVPNGVPAGMVQVKVYRSSVYSNGYDVMMLSGSQVPVTFQVNNATTNWGDVVYVTGGKYELSNWSTATLTGTNNPIMGGPMGPAETYSGFYPSWLETVSVPCGQTIEFKFVKINSTGGVTWEGGSNHSFSSPACGTNTPTTITVNWQN
jgi:glycosidase